MTHRLLFEDFLGRASDERRAEIAHRLWAGEALCERHDSNGPRYRVEWTLRAADGTEWQAGALSLTTEGDMQAHEVASAAQMALRRHA